MNRTGTACPNEHNKMYRDREIYIGKRLKNCVRIDTFRAFGQGLLNAGPSEYRQPNQPLMLRVTGRKNSDPATH